MRDYRRQRNPGVSQTRTRGTPGKRSRATAYQKTTPSEFEQWRLRTANSPELGSVLDWIYRYPPSRPLPAQTRQHVDDDLATLHGTVSTQPSHPFTGSGARGVHPAPNPLSVSEVVAMQDAERAAEYRNPAVRHDLYDDDDNYFDVLEREPLQVRTRQVELLLLQNIITGFPEAYRDRESLPSREQVISAAAADNGIPPSFLAACILTEQRDQSANEDRAEFTSGWYNLRNSSIGLSQLLLSNLYRKDLLNGVIDTEGMRPDKPLAWEQSPRYARTTNPSRDESRKLTWALASEELNIFAAARFIRFLADTPPDPDEDLWTAEYYHGQGLTEDRRGQLSNYSQHWDDKLVVIMGDNYGNKAWQAPIGLTVYTWGQRILAASQDIAAAGFFR